MREANKLTTRFVANAKPGKHCDGKGLWLYVQPGRKSWVLRYMIARRAREMGLGPVDLVSLKEARELAYEARRLVLKGLDPIAERKADKRKLFMRSGGPTFAEVCAQFLAAHAGAWKSRKHRNQWSSSFESYCKAIKDTPVGAIDTAAILGVLTPLWSTKVETGKRLQLRIERVLDFAIASGLSSGPNPGRWRAHLDKLLAQPGKLARPTHMPALAYAELPELMAKLAELDTPPAKALRFLVYTAGRTGEVIGARWDEIDVDKAVWTIPAKRMKAGREHRVPLSDAAISILKGIERRGDIAFTFSGKPMAADSLRKCLRDTGELIGTTHGMRSAFRDFARDRGVSGELAEAALAHQIPGKVERAYARSDLLDARRPLMERWGEFLTRPAGEEQAKVIHMSQRA